jgi:hypothetical protein
MNEARMNGKGVEGNDFFWELHFFFVVFLDISFFDVHFTDGTIYKFLDDDYTDELEKSFLEKFEWTNIFDWSVNHTTFFYNAANIFYILQNSFEPTLLEIKESCREDGFSQFQSITSNLEPQIDCDIDIQQSGEIISSQFPHSFFGDEVWLDVRIRLDGNTPLVQFDALIKFNSNHIQPLICKVGKDIDGYFFASHVEESASYVSIYAHYGTLLLSDQIFALTGNTNFEIAKCLFRVVTTSAVLTPMTIYLRKPCTSRLEHHAGNG